jgi:hypothetical protein
MSSLSLEASLRTCKIDQGHAIRVESDRFLNPNNALCIPWNNMNNLGQMVCQDSFMTKRAGCNSANDRVEVENNLRPQYMQYVTLDAAGIRGQMYNEINNITGNFGKQWSATSYPSCSGFGDYTNMATCAQRNRKAQSMNQGARSNNQRSCSGN